ncbi:ATP-binding protein [Aureimonas altamirensis]|uniref:hybrid sensor histidine kinase/response regulator n=1 Tax=Aureimonas altamirensis TaxID=370622 RepID=UPI001E33D719|nr:ATP-binding protein [Aureimonas altamirensis]UHD44055.1 ATP-binding protein [Aureimonas altamirensis]
MTAPQRIVRNRRSYNQWVANEMLEDYALRFTAKRGRRWSPLQLAMTACGGISFLALEAIGGAITLHFGFWAALAATLTVSTLIFCASLPITYYAARYGIDMDLLTRGAGFGYLGSTVTSLIYASFTFIFFAVEAAIMAMALEMMTGLPLWAGYIVCAVAVIPIVAHGMNMISRFQIVTQPFWLVLNLAPFVFLAIAAPIGLADWTAYSGTVAAHVSPVAMFGAASAILFALTAQIGEQVDYLRFMPERVKGQRNIGWWVALLAGGPGWIVIGAAKILAGSFLAVLAVSYGLAPSEARHPTEMYRVAYATMFDNPAIVIAATGIFVVVAQMKINVTNAYAGSIAWSNFFSRLTHHHPGRVVWLVFNVAIALLLMEMGVLQALEQILGLYAIVAVSWVFALTADLVVNKPLGLSPKPIEFKRAHLYDINPVGFGAMGAGILASTLAYLGLFGATLAALHVYVAMVTAFAVSPLIAWATGGRTYIARVPTNSWNGVQSLRCCVCENSFEPEDMAACPAYSGPICSLCCTLDARCRDMCKTDSRLREQIVSFLRAHSRRLAAFADSPRGHYLAVFATMMTLTGGILALIAFQAALDRPEETDAITGFAVRVFVVFAIVEGIVSWLFVLAHHSRRVAQEETNRQTRALTREIKAHRQTDIELQAAKERAEAASLAKTRFLFGMSHELRTPLNSILGYAQLMEQDGTLPARRREGIKVIRRSGEHLAGLIDGLLDISRIEAGKLQVYRDPISLTALLGELEEMFRMQAGNVGLEFLLVREGTVPDHVRGDEKRLRQILINLLSNAFKFTREGRVILRVRYRSQTAEFTVIDTGPGIPADDLERIFEPFERGDHGAPGSGIGLTITKLLVGILGGEMKVESRLGVGSSFTVRLMLASDTAPRMAESLRGHPTGYLGPRRTILAVDDEPAHRQLLEDILQPLGFTLFTVDSAAAGLQMAELTEPDLFILDVNMPGMDGWELSRRLRMQGNTAKLIMLSADRRPAIPDARLCDDWVSKPLSLQTLLSSIERLLGLEWVCEAALPTPSAILNSPLEPSEIPGPQARAQLADALRIGHARGAHVQLDAIALAHPRTERFVAQVRSRLDLYDLDACLALVEGVGDLGAGRADA